MEFRKYNPFKQKENFPNRENKHKKILANLESPPFFDANAIVKFLSSSDLRPGAAAGDDRKRYPCDVRCVAGDGH